MERDKWLYLTWVNVCSCSAVFPCSWYLCQAKLNTSQSYSMFVLNTQRWNWCEYSHPALGVRPSSKEYEMHCSVQRSSLSPFLFYRYSGLWITFPLAGTSGTRPHPCVTLRVVAAHISAAAPSGQLPQSLFGTAPQRHAAFKPSPVQPWHGSSHLYVNCSNLERIFGTVMLNIPCDSLCELVTALQAYHWFLLHSICSRASCEPPLPHGLTHQEGEREC